MTQTLGLDADYWTPPAVPPMDFDVQCPDCGRKATIRRVRTTGIHHDCPGPWIEGAR